MNLDEVATEIAQRLSAHLPARADGRRPSRRQRTPDDPHWRDHLLFYEYFHGDNGAASAPPTRPAGRGSPLSCCIRAAAPPAPSFRSTSAQGRRALGFAPSAVGRQAAMGAADLGPQGGRMPRRFRAGNGASTRLSAASEVAPPSFPSALWNGYKRRAEAGP